jgi:hypothetical protein
MKTLILVPFFLLCMAQPLGAQQDPGILKQTFKTRIQLKEEQRWMKGAMPGAGGASLAIPEPGRGTGKLNSGIDFTRLAVWTTEDYESGSRTFSHTPAYGGSLTGYSATGPTGIQNFVVTHGKIEQHWGNSLVGAVLYVGLGVLFGGNVPENLNFQASETPVELHLFKKESRNDTVK